MKGHVPTPAAIVDRMVGKLFDGKPPRAASLLIDPGCGTGPFIDGVLRYCRSRRLPTPRILGVELDPAHAKVAREKYADEPRVTIAEEDYLTSVLPQADYVIGNPPYVPITGLGSEEKALYREHYATASGRFDLYLLFFERSLQLLHEGGRICFVTPEKWTYVATAGPLRNIVARDTHVLELEQLHEGSFPGLVTYPMVTLAEKGSPTAGAGTRIVLRDGTVRNGPLPSDTPWSAAIAGHMATQTGATLADVCTRISCGVATGADDIFVLRDLPTSLKPFAFPCISGRQLGLPGESSPRARDWLLVPYDARGRLLSESDLGSLGTYLARPDNKRRLLARTCVTQGGKPWWSYHDSAPFPAMVTPKILCKDIAGEPKFWADREGKLVPRHTVYYMVPRPGVSLDALLAYLNGPDAAAWLRAHSQRAANGFLRLQSATLKLLPVPRDFMQRSTVQAALARAT